MPTTAEENCAYKRFVMTVAQAVDSAHKEGGLLGIGGKQISDAENHGKPDPRNSSVAGLK